MRSKRDGQPIPGTARTITADEQNAALGIDKTTPKPAPLPLTPNQARRAQSGAWVGNDLDPPDYEASVVSDPEAVARVLGLRPEDFDAPLGSQPEGMPIAQPGIRPKIEPRPERRRPEDAASTPEQRAQSPDAAEQLRRGAQEHVRRQVARTEWAREHGSAEQKRTAAEEAQQTAELVRRIKDKLGGAL